MKLDITSTITTKRSTGQWDVAARYKHSQIDFYPSDCAPIIRCDTSWPFTVAATYLLRIKIASRRTGIHLTLYTALVGQSMPRSIETRIPRQSGQILAWLFSINLINSNRIWPAQVIHFFFKYLRVKYKKMCFWILSFF